ncbi:hypothetical protein LZ31DRAFT_132985 [Colletotrichum somersetense]|nr:hypothetical protein LZ31DRAFT_132985 [Colletotrichum somersetense]
MALERLQALHILALNAKILEDLATGAGPEATGRKEIDRLYRKHGCFYGVDANQTVRNRVLLRILGILNIKSRHQTNESRSLRYCQKVGTGQTR